MTTLKFKCELLTDVILNQKAATEGPNQTLDFIPGSCFLGIVASELYKKIGECEKTMEIFHSGKVRFGDAHPSKDKFRGLKVPASMFYPKLKKASEKCYVHHLIPNLDDDDLKKEQIKQCRSGFYDFSTSEAKQVKTDTNFAIKSAYDKDKRRSKDQQMYGYQSLQKGLTLYFEVEADNYSEEIKSALTGKKRVGRSRTAQYGLVKISECEFNEIGQSSPKNKIVTVYADGRLIILDDFGMPTFRPSAEDLGIKGGNIIWEKSQIRTFQYSPWNYTRQCFDTDRCGIEKGSVFVVDVTNCNLGELKSRYIGSYKNEGFGKVIYNPAFLDADANGIAKYKLLDADKEKKTDAKKMDGTILLNFIKKKSDEESIEKDIYKMVNDWVRINRSLFKDDSFASQWGKIRSIAMLISSKTDLENELFNKTRKGERQNKEGIMEDVEIPDAYLNHGIAVEKWKERGRLNKFKEFVNALDDSNVQMAVINLAAEMAKEKNRKN